jgi:hypothetical protein
MPYGMVLHTFGGQLWKISVSIVCCEYCTQPDWSAFHGVALAARKMAMSRGHEAPSSGKEHSASARHSTTRSISCHHHAMIA